MFKLTLILLIIIPICCCLKCYKTDLRGISDQNVKIKSYEVKGFITKAKISKHSQYKVIKEYRLCKPIGEDSCYASTVKEMELKDEEEMRTAIEKGMCLVGRECLRDDCYDYRDKLCDGDVRDRWAWPKKRSTLPFFNHVTRWACQVTWECENREFETNVQILTVDPITYRLETPQGGFVVCKKEDHSVKDSLGYYVNCPKIITQTVEVKFHCIQHPERILCRDHRDHALLDFTREKTNTIYDTIYHITNDTQVLMKEKLNELGSGTLTDMERVMRELEMDNLQTILDLSIIKNKMYSLSNLVLELILQGAKTNPRMLGEMIGDGYLTEMIKGKEAKQCEGSSVNVCKCWGRDGDFMKCKNSLDCKRKEHANETIKILDVFTDYDIELSLVEDVKFKNKISDIWIDDLREESRRGFQSSDSEISGSEAFFFFEWISAVRDWFLKNLISLVSLIMASYSLHLHLRKK